MGNLIAFLSQICVIFEQQFSEWVRKKFTFHPLCAPFWSEIQWGRPEEKNTPHNRRRIRFTLNISYALTKLLFLTFPPLSLSRVIILRELFQFSSHTFHFLSLSFSMRWGQTRGFSLFLQFFKAAPKKECALLCFSCVLLDSHFLYCRLASAIKTPSQHSEFLLLLICKLFTHTHD